MNITKEWLEEKAACREGVEWFINQKEDNPLKIIKLFIVNKEHLNWANWLIVRIMSRKQYLQYAVYAAEQVIDIYEKRHPKDKRPREAIEAAKKCIDEDSVENRNAAYAAAADAAYAAADAYAAAAYAAYAAAAAAADAAYAADAAAAYAAAAYAADAYAADAAKKEKQIKILNYGITLLK